MAETHKTTIHWGADRIAEVYTHPNPEYEFSLSVTFRYGLAYDSDGEDVRLDNWEVSKFSTFELIRGGVGGTGIETQFPGDHWEDMPKALRDLVDDEAPDAIRRAEGSR